MNNRDIGRPPAPDRQGGRQKLSFWERRKRVWTVRLKRTIRKTRAFITGAFARMSEISVDKTDIFRWLISAGWVIFFAMLQTTFFVRFPLFGSHPDLMLHLTLAIAMTEGCHWGGAFGIAAAVVIESLGSVGASWAVLVFCLAGYFCGLLMKEQFSDTAAVRIGMILAAAAIRFIMTVISGASMPAYAFGDVIAVAGREFLATAAVGAIPHIAAYLSLKWAHKTRAERVN